MTLPGDDKTTPLSAREAEVAKLYIEGLSYKEIARDLGIAPGTIRTHLNAIYRKLEVTNRIELLNRLTKKVDDDPGRNSTAGEPVHREPGSSQLIAPELERRQLTILFVDMVGSTRLSAVLDAEDMHELLLAYRACVCEQLTQFGGHPAGFPGDGVVACFGWPSAIEDAAERAVAAGLSIARAVGKLRAPDGRSLAARIGIATGMVVVDAGAGPGESITGSTPNLAARLQALAKPGGVVISATTRDLIGDLFGLDALGLREIKGLPQPIPVFRVLDERAEVSRFEARHASDVPPMVGRDQELALLRDRWARTLKGEGQAVLLEGEPGIGKSRIAASMIEESAANGAAILRYQTAPQQGDSPLWPVRQQLMAAAGLRGDMEPEEQFRRLRDLIQRPATVPNEALLLIADLLDIATDETLPAMSAERRRDLLLDSLCDRLVALAATTPVLVLFEDLHWIDPTSLELIERLLGYIEGAQVLLLLTTRPEGEPSLAGYSHMTRVTLSRLSKEAAEAIVIHRAGGIELDGEIVRTILARSDGVPLYIEEMTAAILESGADADSVPASLQDSLMARLDRLGDAKEMAQLAAVVGREFDHELLSAVAGNDAGLEDAIDRLLRAELVFRRGRRYFFKHALVQDVAYQSLVRNRQKELHERIAEVLLGQFQDRTASQPELLAHHLERAGRTTAAIDYYARAADMASNRGANREARRYLERALKLVESLPPGAERDRREVSSLTALGRITVALSGHASSATAEIYQHALTRCRAAGLGMAEFPIVLGLTVRAAVSGDEHTALDLARQLRKLADSDNDPTLDVQASYALGVTHCWRGERAEALRQFETGSRAYTAEQHPRHIALYSQDPGVVCYCRGAINLWHMGQIDAAEDRLRAAYELAQRLRHPFSINYMLNWRAIHALELDDLERAEQAVAETLTQAEEQGFAIWRTMGMVSRGRFVLAYGEPREALAAIERALESVHATGTGCYTGYALGLLADALCRIGRPAEGLARAGEALTLIDQGATDWGKVEVLRAAARCHLAADGGDDRRAVETLEHALAVADRQTSRIFGLRAAMDLAPILAERGDRRRACELLVPRLRALDAGQESWEITKAQELLDSLR